ncbi:MAG: Rne/Rng family ribonuclease [Holosporales bacterium]|jgi:ribonuclease E|nr:Rne/Rng family ribonuclease [Holosporales bacterium]
MSGKLLIDASFAGETRVAVIGADGQLEVFESECPTNKPIKGNVYLAKIVRIEPAVQAAFIDYGGSKHGFLPFSEIHYDYFNKNVVKSAENDLSFNGGEADRKARVSPLKIQEVIATKQVVLVQAEKEIRGNKCAFFSTFISLPGRYCVLMPNPPKGKKNAISKRIEASEKERLKQIFQSLNIPEGVSCIVRTAGDSRTKHEIKRDFEYLQRLWEEIREKMANSAAPSLIHEEGNIIKRSIRDLYQRTMGGIVVHGKEAAKEAKSFMKIYTPTHVKKIELYEDSAKTTLFDKYGVDDSVAKILSPVVGLPSGGSIVINSTEALTAIDVNSGKLKNERDMDGTALRTNLEAAVETARQIKLRDISGIIVIDFIDMDDHTSCASIEKKVREAMKNDSAHINIGKISQFGLLEMSRQRMRTSVIESSFVQCRHCNGCGKVLSDETVAITVIRRLENELASVKAKHVIVEVSRGVDLYILNHKRKLLSELETKFSTFIEIASSANLSAAEYNVVVKEPQLNEYAKVKSAKPDEKPNGKPKAKRQRRNNNASSKKPEQDSATA